MSSDKKLTNMKAYLLIGACGTGKTWVMKELIKRLECYEAKQLGLYHWVQSSVGHCVLGKYDGSTFEGGDRLSMAVMSDNIKVLPVFSDKIIIAEGDRFTNSSFITYFNPLIIKIKGDGAQGRLKRGSTQTARHINAIYTRVSNISHHVTADDSFMALSVMMEAILDGVEPPSQKATNNFFY